MTISNTAFSGNSPYFFGRSASCGAIDNRRAMTITTSTFYNNYANNNFTSGGAICNGGTLTITDSTFNSNSSQGNNGGNGGAIFNYAGTLAVTNSTFSGNSATTSGGAIYSQGGTVKISNSRPEPSISRLLVLALPAFMRLAMRSKAVLLDVALLLSVVAAFSQNQTTDKTLVTIRPQWAMQGLDPMNPTVFTSQAAAPAVNAIMRQVTVANYTNKTVTSLEYGWRTSTPLGCTDSTLPVGWKTASAKVTIAPGNEGNITAPDALSRPGSSNQLAQTARASHTPMVLVTIGLLKVNFSDGSTWSDDETVPHNAFDNGRAEKEYGCHAPTPAEIRAKAAQQ